MARVCHSEPVLAIFGGTLQAPYDDRDHQTGPVAGRARKSEFYLLTGRCYNLRPFDQLRFGYMPNVRVRENEPFEVAMRRFKRACEKAGVLSEVRRREYYEKPTQERKRKQAAAVKRHMKKVWRDSARRTRLY